MEHFTETGHFTSTSTYPSCSEQHQFNRKQKGTKICIYFVWRFDIVGTSLKYLLDKDYRGEKGLALIITDTDNSLKSELCS